MPIPQGVNFDRWSQVTTGLEAKTAGMALTVNGVALTTLWLSNARWTTCYDLISTSWSPCFVQPVTSWTLIPGFTF